jgi:metallo-beta-lactamase family protein
LPLLVKRGFRGPIYTNAACRDLLPVLLRDTAELAARDVERSNRRRDPDERPAVALYDLQDVERTLELVHALRYDERRALLPGLEVCVRDAGHILGSSSLELWCSEGPVTRKLVFSGDLGQYDSPILQDPHHFDTADLVLMESTYGERLHRDRAATVVELGEIIAQAARDRGNVLIPAFAVGRSQEILYLLGLHHDAWQLRNWQIFLDSPMAIEASKIYWRHAERFDADAVHLRAQFAAMPELSNLHLCRTPDESRAISGMCNGGRILHHLMHNLERPECHVVITGFQAPGTLGRALVDRAPFVRIYGHSIRVAAKVHTLGGLSAHGDQDDLLKWYEAFEGRPPVRLVHGEPRSADALRAKLAALGAQVAVAKAGERLDLVTMEGLR